MTKITDLSYEKPEKKAEDETPILGIIFLVMVGGLFAWFCLAAVVGRVNIF